MDGEAAKQRSCLRRRREAARSRLRALGPLHGPRRWRWRRRIRKGRRWRCGTRRCGTRRCGTRRCGTRLLPAALLPLVRDHRRQLVQRRAHDLLLLELRLRPRPAVARACVEGEGAGVAGGGAVESALGLDARRFEQEGDAAVPAVLDGRGLALELRGAPTAAAAALLRLAPTSVGGGHGGLGRGRLRSGLCGLSRRGRVGLGRSREGGGGLSGSSQRRHGLRPRVHLRCLGWRVRAGAAAEVGEENPHLFFAQRALLVANLFGGAPRTQPTLAVHAQLGWVRGPIAAAATALATLAEGLPRVRHEVEPCRRDGQKLAVDLAGGKVEEEDGRRLANVGHRRQFGLGQTKQRAAQALFYCVL